MEAIKAYEKALKVLADRTRITILHRIKQGEMCGCDLIKNLDISQPTLSHHLKVLSENGFILGRKDKTKTLYMINEARIDTLFNQFKKLLESTINC